MFIFCCVGSKIGHVLAAGFVSEDQRAVSGGAATVGDQRNLPGRALAHSLRLGDIQIGEFL